MKKITENKIYEKGQTLAITAVAMVALIVVVGLAIDGSMLFLNYTRLKRAVDAASVAAANDFKRGASGTTINVARMQDSAREILLLHELDINKIDAHVYVCDKDGAGVRDPNLQTEAPDFYAKCPVTGGTSTQLPRKLVYVRAFEDAPLYFLSLIGFQTVRITTTAIAEAAPVDLVIVIDTSESMGKDTTSPTAYDPADFDPAGCNFSNTCQPLQKAKDAAKALIQTMYKGYDRVAIVTFDTRAYTRFSYTCAISTDDCGDVDKALTYLDDRVKLHDDPPVSKLFWYYDNGNKVLANPVNPEDRDGDGGDLDTSKTSTVCTLSANLWDSAKNIPCDDATKFDAFDWNLNGVYDASDGTTSSTWMASHDPEGASHTPHPPMSLVSTCSGCGIRVASNNLITGGRANAVWVMVFLSDGIANMSDTPDTNPYNSSTKLGVKSIYPNGYCLGGISAGTAGGRGAKTGLWATNCIKPDVSTRYCINPDFTTCPLNTTRLSDPANGFTEPYALYSPEDYARDMTDVAALLKSTNSHERLGNDIAIFTVGLGTAAGAGEPLLRYMAAVGDDGDRETDPCNSVASMTKCGQYYFAATPNDLLPIFEDIASRIFTKISE